MNGAFVMPMFKRSMLILLIIAFIAIAATSFYVTENDDYVMLESEKSMPKEFVTVYVSGAVRRPGVVTLAAGERVVMAVRKCGDVLPTADTGAVNMAEVLYDGMHIHVVERISDKGASSLQEFDDGRVNINLADEKTLDTLPGIGEAIAKRIVDYRTENGNFQSLEDLMNVRGIGQVKYEKIKDKIKI